MIPDRNSAALLKLFEGKRILVTGDLVLDHYLEGKVSRISPEAPVPVVSLGENSERWIPGGAANVALNVVSLGGIPCMSGVVGNDRNGELLLSLLSDAGVDVSAVVADSGRPTTVKTRIMGRNQQLMRVDREKTSPLDYDINEKLRCALENAVRNSDSVILEDYNKGVLSPDLIQHIINLSGSAEVPVSVDPKILNFWEYRGASLFKPNRHEAGTALGAVIESVEQAFASADIIREKLSAGAVLLTLGSRGSVLVQGNAHEPVFIPTVARHVFDVSGAGDSVIAVMGLAICCEMSLYDAARLANLAAAAVCAEPGVYAVQPSDIVREAGRFE